MKLNNYEDLISRQKSKELVLKLYESVQNRREYGLKDWITRTALDVMNNIAEGFELQDKKLFKQANGNLVAVSSMTYVLLELDSISLDEFNNVIDIIHHTQKMIGAYIKII